MPYYDNFWHINALENITSPACLTDFLTDFVKLKAD